MYILNSLGFQVNDPGTGAATGQLLPQANGTYIIQQSVVDGDPTHTLIAAARTSPQEDNTVENAHNSPTL